MRTVLKTKTKNNCLFYSCIHSWQINKLSNRQILQTKIVKIGKDGNGNRQKKINTQLRNVHNLVQK